MQDSFEQSVNVSASDAKTLVVDIAGTSITLIQENMFKITGGNTFIVSQFQNKASTGGIALEVRERFGDFNDQSFQKTLDLMDGNLSDFRTILFSDGDHYFYNVTTAGRLHATAGRRAYGGVQDCLSDALNRELDHLIIPTISTGVSGALTDEQSAKVIAKALYDLFSNPDVDQGNLKLVIAVWDPDQSYCQKRWDAFSQIFSNPGLYQAYDVDDVGMRVKEDKRLIDAKAREMGLEELPFLEITNTLGERVIEESEEPVDDSVFEDDKIVQLRPEGS